MPWSETTAMGERTKVIDDLLDRGCSMSELCGKYGSSRKTGYKWIDRFRLEGVQGLEDHRHVATVSTTERAPGSSRRRSPPGTGTQPGARPS